MTGGNFRFNFPVGFWSFTADNVARLTSIEQGIDHALKEDRACTRVAFLNLDFTPVLPAGVRNEPRECKVNRLTGSEIGYIALCSSTPDTGTRRFAV